jgi:pilus assembly protein Flp/PilA
MRHPFLSDESGQGLTEYAIIIALVAVVVVASLRILGSSSSNALNGASNQLS